MGLGQFNFSSCFTFSLTLVMVLLVLLQTVLGDDCKKFSTCACRLKSGVEINFASYKQRTHPLFENIATTSSDPAKYTYDPCEPLTDPGQCIHNVVCQRTGSGAYPLGTTNEAEYSGDPYQNTLKVVYITNTTNSGRTTTIDLRCGDLKFEGPGEDTPNTGKYKFTMHHPIVCRSGLSTGSILLIIFFVLVLIYIVGGMLYLRFAHGARGKEQIPNIDFWEDFPLLVRDGAVFVSKGCKPDPTYQQI